MSRPDNHKDAYAQQNRASLFQQLSRGSGFGASIGRAFQGASNILQNIGETNVLDQAQQYTDKAALEDGLKAGAFGNQSAVTGLSQEQTRNVLDRRIGQIDANNERALAPLMEQAKLLESQGNYAGISALGEGQSAVVQDALNNYQFTAEKSISDKEKIQQGMDAKRFYDQAIASGKQGIYGEFNNNFDQFLLENNNTIQQLAPEYADKYISNMKTLFDNARKLTGDNSNFINASTNQMNSQVASLTEEYQVATSNIGKALGLTDIQSSLADLSASEANAELNQYVALTGSNDADEGLMSKETYNKLTKAFTTKAGRAPNNRDMLGLIKTLGTEVRLVGSGKWFTKQLEDSSSALAVGIDDYLKTVKAQGGSLAEFTRKKGELKRELQTTLNGWQTTLTDATRVAVGHAKGAAKAGGSVKTMDTTKFKFKEFNREGSALQAALGGQTDANRASSANEISLRKQVRTLQEEKAKYLETQKNKSNPPKFQGYLPR